jgi:Protein of unknown function (DUF3800)
MYLNLGGIDIFYIDESHDRQHYVVTAICIPFLRNVEGIWQITWPNHLAAAKAWRKFIRDTLHIPTKKELHGVKLASGRGQFLHGKLNSKYKQAASAYQQILMKMEFIPDGGIMSASASRNKYLYGHERLEAAMYALFQRMRKKCLSDKTNGLALFDQGHPEYRRLYRMAQTYLPTGSQMGTWGDGKSTKSLPMDMFTKDANEKNSKHCFFTQVADLIAYAAFLKIKGENQQLTNWQAHNGFGQLYDFIPKSKINTKVSNYPPKDGIVRLK